jgi:hypothetical protein
VATITFERCWFRELAQLCSMRPAQPTRLSRWTTNLVARRGYHKANIALAAKNARIVWAILAHGGEFEAKAGAA